MSVVSAGVVSQNACREDEPLAFNELSRAAIEEAMPNHARCARHVAISRGGRFLEMEYPEEFDRAEKVLPRIAKHAESLCAPLIEDITSSGLFSIYDIKHQQQHCPPNRRR
jgi:hypothetical protein